MSAEVEIPALVLEHLRFFDHLVELIPARFYHEEETPAKLRYVPKEERQKEAELRKAKSKAAKLAKLDPDQAQTALQIQQQAQSRTTRENQNVEGAADTDAEPQIAELQAPRLQDKHAGVAPRLDELREKLNKRLQDLREQRKADERRQQTEKAKQYREKRRKVLPQPQQQRTGKRKSAEALPQQPPASANNLSFGMLDFGEDGRRGKRQRKATKAEMLQEAENNAAAQADLANSSAGQLQLQKEAWGSALASARGEKVYDDPKLLRRSLKKDEKRRKKSAASWKQRERQQQQQGKERQQKRRENLQARVQAKQQQKVARREKKLMRPGFEGRRDTFINGP